MWKKPENEQGDSSPSIQSRKPAEQLKDRAIIGPSISIRGELSGEEDLLIQGQVEGKINLKNHNVTVGKSGRIKADIYGKIISVEGEVQGDLFGEEKIVLRQEGVVRGNITSPRVNLEDGAKFKGSIDMDAKGREQRTLSQSGSQNRITGTQNPVEPTHNKGKKDSAPQRKEMGPGLKAGTPPSRP